VWSVRQLKHRVVIALHVAICRFVALLVGEHCAVISMSPALLVMLAKLESMMQWAACHHVQY
jgi:hypothetical protein